MTTISLTRRYLSPARPKLPVARKSERAGWSDDFARTVVGQKR
jgi:hypothetical protein